MIKKIEYVCVFLSGGVIYNLIELLWRGYTHWSMTIAGGLCLLIIHILNHKLRGRSILFKCAVGCVVITMVEFAVGVIVNLILNLNVWNYSSMPGNILGQICPAFTCLWFVISYPACQFSSIARRFFGMIEIEEREEKFG